MNSSSILSQVREEVGTSFKLSGSWRARGFALSRDIPLSRQSLTHPTVDILGFYQNRLDQEYEKITQELENRSRGLPSSISSNKESPNFFDTRALLNLEINPTQNLSAVIGIVVGDIPFGGRALQPRGPNTTDPAVVGIGSGGELQNASGINISTSALNLNYKLPNYNFSTRIGLQFFSSVQGRVMFTIGAGVNVIKDFPEKKYSIESGWIRARERTLTDVDSNGFNDRNYQSANIYFLKYKYFQIKNLKNEVYSYYSNDNDPTDEFRETGDLIWTGVFNEYRLEKFTFIAHGIYNNGKVRVARTIVDEQEEVLYQKRDRYKIAGYLLDFQVNYDFSNLYNLSFIAIGTSGRPGSDVDGLPASYKGSGYRTLAPAYAVSNIGIDFIGGYALFNARSMSGLVEYGLYGNVILGGPWQLNLGYYRLYASKAPRLGFNREYNSLFQKESSNFIGEEWNLNLKWNLYNDFTLHFRSGYFLPYRGLKAINDYLFGKYIREAFITAEYRF